MTTDREPLFEIASEVAAGHEVDWSTVVDSHPELADRLQSLQQIEGLARHFARFVAPGSDPRPSLSPGTGTPRADTELVWTTRRTPAWAAACSRLRVPPIVTVSCVPVRRLPTLAAVWKTTSIPCSASATVSGRVMSPMAWMPGILVSLSSSTGTVPSGSTSTPSLPQDRDPGCPGDGQPPR